MRRLREEYKISLFQVLPSLNKNPLCKFAYLAMINSEIQCSLFSQINSFLGPRCNQTIHDIRAGFRILFNVYSVTV
jgi:hypothetical protein